MGDRSRVSPTEHSPVGAGVAGSLRDPYSSSAPHSSSAPVIGLTTYLEQAQTGVWDVQAAFLPKVYFDAVNRAGGIAVLLPPQHASAAIARRVIGTLDGLIVTGGKDVDPALYGQPAHPSTDEPRRDRDAWEQALLTAALESELPFLGICRGAQMLNVALGGTLNQHVPDIVGSARYQLGGGRFTTVPVDIDPTSKLAGLLPDAQALEVPVYHHQSIDRVGDGLRVTAATDDGIVEAIELEGAAFAMAVQWHPEESPDDLRLFAGLVDAARDYHEARSIGGRPAGEPAAPRGRAAGPDDSDPTDFDPTDSDPTGSDPTDSAASGAVPRSTNETTAL